MRGRSAHGHRAAVITGAGGGIGAATDCRPAAEGYRAVLTGRRAEPLGNVAKQMAPTAVDVTDRAAVRAPAARLDRCDVLVDVAGGTIARADRRAMDEPNVLGPQPMTDRSRGDAAMVGPVVAEDVTRPPHVTIDLLVPRFHAQAARHEVHRAHQDRQG
ncbi:SDR family NAD(P)-dependent oxidoreductase [Thermomonospora umbrina]|uniref:Short subunit dehydrogenase n=1 Tax=Thermomonospora umbrina TaxID=111806 RepID=A0A3D9SVL5_9ACTN|nr:SDR family NAD(P)-dependent oxidoreductase [Thermomonospora umbrina]REE99992.1 short subunit dehydrogenase [Thermomonospora umbrina]